MKKLFSLLINLAFIFCYSSDLSALGKQTANMPTANISTANTSTDKINDLLEAAFRFFFEYTGPRQAKAYYLEVEKKDPHSDLLNRFKDHYPPVKPVSQVAYANPLGVCEIAIDPVSGETATIYFVTNITMHSATRAQVYGGYWASCESSQNNISRYKVLWNRDTGVWDVKDTQMLWISEGDNRNKGETCY